MTTTENGKIKQIPDWRPPYEVSLADLEKKDIPPLRWLVEGLLPEGVSMLAGPPKSYKSYLALFLALCISLGIQFFGRKTSRTSCIYFDLESTERRAKIRTEQVGLGFPDNFYVIPWSEEVGTLGKGFEQTLLYELIEHDAKLAIIDVFQSIRPPMKRTQTGYDRDYEDIAPIRKIASETGASIILVNHTVKMKQSNVFNQVAGSIGTFGALDAMWVIDREDPYGAEASFYVTGRDLEPQKLSIRWNPFQWQLLGSAEDVERERRINAFDVHPITQTVRTLVHQGGGHWEGSASDLKQASQYLDSGKNLIYENVQTIGKFISSHIQDFHIVDEMSVEASRKGHGGSRGFIFNVINDNHVTNVTDVSSVTNNRQG